MAVPLWNRSRYTVYYLEKYGKPYIGSAVNGVQKRYNSIEKLLLGIKNERDIIIDIPDRYTARGVEQLIIELNNGGSKIIKRGGATYLANLINAVSNPIKYSQRTALGRKFLEDNYPMWQIQFKFTP